MKLKTGCLTFPAAAMVLLFMLLPAAAHWTNLDKYGCHKNTAAKTYDCHIGVHAGTSYPSQAAMLADVTPTPVPVPVPAPVDSPAFLAALGAWNSHMLTVGAQVAAVLADPTQPANIKQDAVYYDGTWVFLQMQQLTGDAAWHIAAENAHAAYRSYLDPNSGKANGYSIFPHGLHLMGDDATLITMAQWSAFASSYPLEWTASAGASREVAYNVQSKVMAVAAGGTVWGLEEQTQQVFAHFGQWTQLLNEQPVTGMPAGYPVPTYVRPFMAALSSYALIEWAGTDPARLKQISDTLTPFWELLWSKCFLAQATYGNQTLDMMMYTSNVAADGTGGMDPAPDLNLLIAPVYAWLYAQTGNVIYRDRHDLLFIGGVQGAYLVGGKRFNQNYQRSFQGLEWRK